MLHAGRGREAAVRRYFDKLKSGNVLQVASAYATVDVLAMTSGHVL